MILNDGCRETKVMTSDDGQRHIIASYALNAAGHCVEEGRWLGGLGPYPQGARVPPSAILSEMPSAADVARVHAEASAQ